MYYYDLIREVLSRQKFQLDPAHISGVLTQINLDTRFSYLGKSEWGLKVWVPTKVSRKLPTIALMNKELADDDESNDLDEEKDPLADLEDEELDGAPEEETDEDPFEKEDGYDIGSDRPSRNSWK